ncbi:MAG: dNTP triphosphohydrolase [Pirellulales bacterium]
MMEPTPPESTARISGQRHAAGDLPSASPHVVDRREMALLAPYATFSQASRGRVHEEPWHPYRGPFQRDRDRILHSGAFRRLSGKLQVFTGNMGDYHRTRLTHTMEVASISRTIGRALELNEDLIEALALLHDIGHPPFGHSGESALASCLPAGQTFSHNRYALTLVTEIERPYAAFPGLNLTYEVLAGQTHRVDKDLSAHPTSLEAQVVDLADSVTYDAHDCDDAIKLRLLTLDDLCQVPLIARCVERVRVRFGELPSAILRRQVVHDLIDVQVADLIHHSRQQIATAGWQSALQAAESSIRLNHSPELCQEKQGLERFLYQHVYRHPELTRVRQDAQRRITRVVEHFTKHPEQLTEFFQRRAAANGPLETSVEYVAGMTDRFFDQLYQQLFPS